MNLFLQRQAAILQVMDGNEQNRDKLLPPKIPLKDVKDNTRCVSVQHSKTIKRNSLKYTYTVHMKNSEF